MESTYHVLTSNRLFLNQRGLKLINSAANYARTTFPSLEITLKEHEDKISAVGKDDLFLGLFFFHSHQHQPVIGVEARLIHPDYSLHEEMQSILNISIKGYFQHVYEQYNFKQC